MKATEMEGRTPDGKFAVGNKPVNGLDKNPQNRHHGAWHKEDTPRYWLETMMKMKDSELEAIIASKESSTFKKKLAECILNGEWTEIKEMIEQVYGKMPIVNITAEADNETSEEANKFIRGFALP